ncbi:hypothetical protein ScPMuIL_003264 [Solemya velum]
MSVRILVLLCVLSLIVESADTSYYSKSLRVCPVLNKDVGLPSCKQTADCSNGQRCCPVSDGSRKVCVKIGKRKR